MCNECRVLKKKLEKLEQYYGKLIQVNDEQLFKLRKLHLERDYLRDELARLKRVEIRDVKQEQGGNSKVFTASQTAFRPKCVFSGGHSFTNGQCERCGAREATQRPSLREETKQIVVGVDREEKGPGEKK